MPNHCTNHVEISHEDSKKFKEFADRAIKQEGNDEFDFNGIVPMPKSLEIESGTMTELGMACFDQAKFDELKKYGWFDERYDNASTPAELKAVLEAKEQVPTIKLGKQAIDNIKKHGYATWYDWANDYWGTKWNAYGVTIQELTDNKVRLQFDTAWSPPTPIFDELEAQGFTVRGFWHEEGGAEDYIGDGNGVDVDRTIEVTFYDN